MSDPITITLDGRVVEATAGEMLIAVGGPRGHTDSALLLSPETLGGGQLPNVSGRSVGRARPGPGPAPTPVMDGMEVQTRSELAREAQRATMEFLLINHPLDCPICDQGGECELQDLALEYRQRHLPLLGSTAGGAGPGLGLAGVDRHDALYPLYPLRFGSPRKLPAIRNWVRFGRGEFMKIGTYVERAMNSELSGCVIDLCPVGALNARPSRMSARAWELNDHPGIGEHDGVGSHLSRHILRGRQIRCVPRTGRDNQRKLAVGPGPVQLSGGQPPGPLVLAVGPSSRTTGFESVGRKAWGWAAEILAESGTKAGLIHPSSTVEECFRFQQLLRRCGAETVEHRTRMSDFRGGGQYPRWPTLGCDVDRVAENDVVVLMGSFLRHDQPILNHRLRQAMHSGTEVWVINPAPFDWNFAPTEEVILSPRQWLTLLQSVERAHALKAKEAYARFSDRLAQRLGEADNALFWLGPLALNHPDASLLYASAHNLCKRTGTRLGTLPEGANAPGAWLAGCVSHRGPGGKAVDGVDLPSRLEEPPDLWVFYGTDPACDVTDPAQMRQALAAARKTIGFQSFVPDPQHLPYDLLLPIPTVGERGGHLINLEGRWQSMTPAVSPPGEVRDGTEVLVELLRMTGHDPGFAGVSLLRTAAAWKHVRLCPTSRPKTRGGCRKRAFCEWVPRRFTSRTRRPATPTPCSRPRWRRTWRYACTRKP